MTKAQQLLAIHKTWEQNCACDLKNFCTQAVFGTGNPNADIVFIGEAPGKDEDLQGEPFVGRAGKFLNEMLAMIKLSRADVYITNTVKYRPPNNRDPLPTEKAACYEWLVEESNCIQPRLIITLGRHAMNTFLPDEKISDIHGKLVQRNLTFTTKDGISYTLSTNHVLALYHPAAAMYNGALRTTLLEDFKKIPSLLRELP